MAKNGYELMPDSYKCQLKSNVSFPSPRPFGIHARVWHRGNPWQIPGPSLEMASELPEPGAMDGKNAGATIGSWLRGDDN